MLSEFGKKIFLDRYALKKHSKKVEVGERVLVIVSDSGERQLGEIYDVGEEVVSVYIGDNTIEVPYSKIDCPLELDPREMFSRIAFSLSEIEKEKWYENFMWMLADFKFVPGGRILAGAGTDNLTYFNCFVLPSPHDSRQGIMNTLTDMIETMSRGGGVGINLSTLRPKNSQVKGVNGRSSGAVSWGEIFSFGTGLIEQGGSRRGALMLILNVWHPDIIDFIESKKDMSRIINANISVGITDDFMQAVKDNTDWNLRFPNTSNKDYDKKWDGNINNWEGEIVNYKTIKARDLWDKIIDSAWTSAEPGLFFIDRYNQMSNSWYYNQIICTNPCGEQGLPAWGVCNLGAINLSKFVSSDGIVKWYDLGKTIHYAVRFLDNVIDKSMYINKENEEQQKSERRVGLGTMGLAEMLIRMKIRYGSNESLRFIDELYRFICHNAYLASSNLAKEKGVFPRFDSHKYREGNFIKTLDKRILKRIQSYGIRNVTLLTQAPTGTTGTMLETSTGIEPFYFWEYKRQGRFGEQIIKNHLVDDIDNLPDYFVTSQDLTPEEHVKVQAAIQKWTDSSISKTCNVPESWTKEQISNIYMLMYDLGCKGGTVYRDRSRNVQVLSSIEKPKTRDIKLEGKTYKKSTPVGSAYITVNKNGIDPFEVFINVGKAGSDVAADAESLGRLISLVLRMPSQLNQIEKVKSIVGQLKGIGSGRPQGFGNNRIMSLADAVAQVLQEDLMLKEITDMPDVGSDLCPQCGFSTLIRIEGCQKCFNCSYSVC